MKNRVNRCVQIKTPSRVLPRLIAVWFVLQIYLSLNVFTATAQDLNSTFVPVAPEVLSNSNIRCFYKDSRGYMWIGTEHALIRYDGRNAFQYVNDPNDNASITHNTINTILEGADNQLWIGTAQGLCIYNPELDNFINVDSIKANLNHLNNRYITALEFDGQGRLWIGTHEGGINIYNPVKHEFEYIIDPPQGGILPSSNFINILVNVNDTIWCATKGGLLLYDSRTKHRLPLKSLNRFAESQISAIVRERSGNLVIATLTGEIMRLVPGNRQDSFQRILSGEQLGESANRILSLCFDHKGNMLLGGENSGFNIIEYGTKKLHRLMADEGNGNALPTNSVEKIYADDTGLIWIGTLSNGVFLLDNQRKKFKPAETKADNILTKTNEVRSFAEDPHGNIWIASYGVGLFKMSAGNKTITIIDEINRKILNKNVTSIICDKQGDLWLGTAGKGVYKIKPATNQIINYSVTSEGFGNNQVFCLYEDKHGTVWAGTWGSGLFFFDALRNEFVSATEYDQPNHIPNTAYISDIMEDSKGTFWIGTLYGLYELTRKTGYSFSYRVHLPINNDSGIIGTQIQAIAEDSNYDLWVGTTDALNLRKKDSALFTPIQKGSGTFVNTIRSLLIDQSGNVWIGGNNGLSKFDLRSKTFSNYSREDGLSSNNFNRKAALVSASGKLFFGSSKGFDSFFPDSIRTGSCEWKIVLSDLKINNQSVKPGAAESPLKKHISLTSDLKLSYQQRSFAIDFVAVDHRPSSNYTYCYKLEGFDHDWNCGGVNHSAVYTNIDPGNYVFLVKAANRDGVWIDEPLKLNITIQQVFWKTWWAFCCYATFFIFLIYVLVKIRIERLKLKNEIRFEKLKLEQEQKLSESKTLFFTNVAHEFRTPLSLIMIPLESLMGTNDVPTVLRQRIYTAYKNASRMKRLVNELMDFNKLEVGNLKLHVQHGDLVQYIRETSSAFDEMAEKRSIKFSVTSDVSAIMGWFDRDALERIIFNLLSNAFKFTSDAGEIKLKISVKHCVIADGTLSRCLELVVEDNGIGIASDELPHIFEKFYQARSSVHVSSPGTGIGLSFTKALVELHQGRIAVTSVPDMATIFTILLPIEANHYDVDETVSDNVTNRNILKVADGINPSKNGVMTFDHANVEIHEENDRAKILVVEDNVELREYLVTELRMEFIVLEAKDGSEGLTIALEENPDLIISDVMMPVKNGIELCHAIKSDLNTSHIPFILLTAKATIEDQIHGIETGADLYVSKPFNVRYLITHVQQIIASRRKLYTRFSQDVYLMPGKAASNALDQAFLEKAIDYIIENLKDPQLTVDSVAARLNLSRIQFYRKIKALTGKSVVEFIKMIRMKEAIKLMDAHNLTLSEIAYEVGFNSASYFTRCFKEEYGRTPSEYLEQN